MQKLSQKFFNVVTICTLLLGITLSLVFSNASHANEISNGGRTQKEIERGIELLIEQETHARKMMEAIQAEKEEAKAQKNVMRLFSLHDDPRCDDDDDRDDHREVVCVRRC